MKKAWSREQMRTQAEECIAYFKEYPVFNKLFQGFREKYISYGAFSGTVKVRSVTAEDIEALEGFFKRNFHGQKTVSISAAKFEKALSDSRFGMFTPKDILELYFKEAMTGKKELRKKEEQERNEALIHVRKEYEALPASEWLDSIEWNCGSGAYILKRYREAGEDCIFLRNLLTLGADIINNFPIRKNETEYLAVFAANITGNPHAFDGGTKDGQFLYLLVQWYLAHQSFAVEKSDIFPALHKQRQYLAAGILKDDISNYAMVSGILARKKDGKIHSGMKGFKEEGDMVHVPLSAIAKWAQVECPNQEIYIVENPSVYAMLAKAWKGKKACMCMNGQPRLSAILLLDLLAESGALVYYAGDFDPEGLLIAQKVHQYYKGSFSYWHMSPADYERSKSKERISERRLKMLDKITDDALAEVADDVRNAKLAGYQENVFT